MKTVSIIKSTAKSSIHVFWPENVPFFLSNRTLFTYRGALLQKRTLIEFDLKHFFEFSVDSTLYLGHRIRMASWKILKGGLKVIN